MPSREMADRSVGAPQAQQDRNVEAIAKVEASIMGERSIGERLARYLIRKIGTPLSLALHVVAFAAWLAWNARRNSDVASFDPYPFNLLALVTGVEAILVGLLILVSQNRLQHEADRRAHLTLQINMMAEIEGAKMLQLLDRLCRHVGIEGLSQDLLKELTSDTDPQTIAATLRDSIPSDE